MGFSFITGDEIIVHADNASFDGTSRGGKLTADGQLWIGSTSAPHVRAGSLMAGAGIAITNQAGGIIISNTGGGGGGGTDQLTGNAGVAVEVGTNINVLGVNNITTTGSGDTLSLSVTGTTNHAVQIGNVTGSLSSVSGLGTTGQVLTSNGVGMDPTWQVITAPASTLSGNSGTATQVAGNINVVGGNNILTSGTGATLTVNVAGTTNHAVQIGNSTNSLTSIAVGATGTLLVGASSADPAFGTSANGDFTFTSSTSGGVRTLTVNNTSNTATSAANLIISTAGSSAGDPMLQFTTTANTWTMGADNSVSSPTDDPFVISQSTALGTKNIMSADLNGAINYPLQPSFLATNTITRSNITGDGTNYHIPYNNIIFDQSSSYDGAGNFTAPVTGRYIFFAGVQLNSLDSTMTEGNLQLQTSNRSFYFQRNNAGATRLLSSLATYNGSVISDMDAADVCFISIAINETSGKVVDINNTENEKTYFGGYLAC